MKVIIAGSRNISDYMLVVNAVKSSGYDITTVISGCAVGVDRLGELWARTNNIPIIEMPANWNRDGKKAGPIRNKEMALVADAAVIIWDGESIGTRNMIDCMIKLKKPYHIGMTSSTLENFL
jgi:hypothetical protein